MSTRTLIIARVWVNAEPRRAEELTEERLSDESAINPQFEVVSIVSERTAQS